ncbi:DUF3784 domain-containing protein [Fictibacillus fluitans]|uniref:DUF3784 domain-containing protein n=1 Tax=Fictibacillus fluitans TaxID=3058422 RepID=A0ABT8HWZ4_9BACL|nr:DUF3784 domain-containing protein [Fictibacillus sp. NE201]MDN4525005.1 DUF3784 domain-containing protein [Fictibacillus sp. NE201]
MDQNLLIFGIIFLVLAYFVGVKKQTWLLSGFNQKRVRDQDKLARLIGGYDLIAGLVLVAAAFIENLEALILMPIVLIGFIILLGYVNTRMVE